jgi:hypothetical protein
MKQNSLTWLCKSPAQEARAIRVLWGYRGAREAWLEKVLLPPVMKGGNKVSQRKQRGKKGTLSRRQP